LPFVVLNVSASMASAPRALQEAAMSLGAAPVATFLQVTVPLLSRGIISGAIFSFLVSFDEVVIAKFLSGAETPTLPKRMLDGVFYEMTPMLAAISCTLVLTNVLVAAAALAFSRSHAPVRGR
jgi:putative spermidine/putrescine transport system permease protein